MMHTGTVSVAGVPAPAQLSVSRRLVQLSTLDGRRWQSSARRTRLVSFDGGEVVLEVGGRRFRVALDDPDRFSWAALGLLGR